MIIWATGGADRAAKETGNERNGKRAKTVSTEIGPVEVEIPRDRDGTFEPVIVKKRQRRVNGVDQIVWSLSARGLTTGEISAHPGRGVGRAGVEGRLVANDRQDRRGDERVVEPAVGPGRVRWCSSTLSASKSATAACATRRSMLRSV